MRVLFVFPTMGIYFMGDSVINLGLAYLSTYLKERKHTTGLIIMPDADKERLIASVNAFKPDLVGIAATSNQWRFAKQFGQWIKEETGVSIIYGGWHATLAPEDAISLPYTDYVCIGEAELTLLELLDRLQKGQSTDDIKGLWVRRGDRIFRNPLRPLIENLDTVPFMDLELFGFGRGEYNMQKIEGFRHTLQMIAGRGCPGSCTFCSAKAFREMYQKAGCGKYLRARSPQRVIAEVMHHIKKYPSIDSVCFLDDTFTVSKPWMREFAPLYIKEVHLPFWASARADFIDEEMADLLKAAGCRVVFIGVETGNEEFRYKVAKKRISNDQIRRAFRILHERGIQIQASFIIGLPYDTIENFKETKQFMIELDPDFYALHLYNPFPGTEATEISRQNGWLREGGLPLSYHEEAGIEMPWFPPAKIRECIKEMEDAFYEINLHKKSRGYMDFATSLDTAVKQTMPEMPTRIVSMFEQCFETVWIEAHPPATLTYGKIQILENTDLKLGVGMSPEVYSLAGGGVEFTVEVNGKKVFSKKLDPKQEQADRGWFFDRIPLDKFAGKTASIVFRTAAFGKGGNQYCSAGWGRPCLLVRTPGETANRR